MPDEPVPLAPEDQPGNDLDFWFGRRPGQAPNPALLRPPVDKTGAGVGVADSSNTALSMPSGAAKANYSSSPTPGTDPNRQSIGQMIGARPARPVRSVPLKNPQAPSMQIDRMPATPAAPDVPAPSFASLMQPAVPATPPTESTFSPNRAIQQPPAAPVGSNNPNLVDLAKKQALYGTPIDPRTKDPVTGKSEYSMPAWQRVLGTFANAANGFARNGAAPVFVGPGATNNRYATDEAMREKNLASVNTQIGTQEKLDTTNLNLEKQASRQAYETQTGQAREETAQANTTKAAAMQETADVKQQLADAKKPSEPKTEAELALARSTAIVTGDKMKAAIYGGALEELRKQKAAGKDTSAADLQKFLQVSEFRLRQREKLDKDKEGERAKRYGELDKNIMLKADPAAAAAEKQKIDQGLEAEYAPKYQDLESQADQMRGLTKTGQKVNAGGAQAAPGKKSKPVQSIGGHKVGDPVTLKDGRNVIITQMYSDGKFDHKPAPASK